MISFITIMVLAIAIVVKILMMEVGEKDKWRTAQKKYVVKMRKIEPVRGDILSSEGYALAVSVPYYEIRWDSYPDGLTDKIFEENVDSLAYCLGKEFQKPASYFLNKLLKARAKGNRYVLIAAHVNNVQMERIRQFPIFRLGKYKGGFMINESRQRAKPFPYAARTLGYLQKDGYVTVGLEAAYDNYLRGIEGAKLMRRISKNTWRPVENTNENQIDAKDGDDLQTTINLEIQDVTHYALLRQLQANGAEYGTAVVMEVKTGDIVAISNLKRQKNGSYAEKYNYAVGLAYEPGSTFKLMSLIAAMEDGYVKLTDTVNTGNGTVRYYNHTMRDAHSGLGKITALKAFEESSNVGISKLIYKYYKDNPSQFVDRLYSMRVNQKLGLEIEGEAAPLVKYPCEKSNDKHCDWSGLTLPQMSIGYEVKLTPLQILTFYNAVANNGKMMKPRFVKAIIDHGNIVKTIEPKVLNPAICSKRVVENAHKLLEAVVEEGTARGIKNPYYKIAGKTGTAQMANRGKGYGEKGFHHDYVASFVGYFPADKPAYSIIVAVFKPQSGKIYGSQVAAPVFKEIADRIYVTQVNMTNPINKQNLVADDLPRIKYGNTKDIKSVTKALHLPVIDNGLKSQWTVAFTGEKNIALKNRFVVNRQVPNVKGMGLKDAAYLLGKAGLKVIPIGTGMVVEQSIEPGTMARKGDEIYLKLN